MHNRRAKGVDTRSVKLIPLESAKSRIKYLLEQQISLFTKPDLAPYDTLPLAPSCKIQVMTNNLAQHCIITIHK